MKIRWSRLSSALLNPIGITIVLMIYAGGFALLQLEAEAADHQCNQLTDQLVNFENQARFHELSAQLTNIDIKLDRIVMSLGEVPEEDNAHSTREIERLSREIERLNGVIAVSEEIQGVRRQLVRSRSETDTICNAVPWLLHLTAASALLMTLAAGAFGFWAGTRKSKI